MVEESTQNNNQPSEIFADFSPPDFSSVIDRYYTRLYKPITPETEAALFGQQPKTPDEPEETPKQVAEPTKTTDPQ